MIELSFRLVCKTLYTKIISLSSIYCVLFVILDESYGTVLDTMSNLSDLLVKELQKRGWSQRELSRRSGISPTQISHVISEQANPGSDFCLAIARALRYSPEEIMRLAGLLPSLPAPVAEEKEIMHLIRSLPASARAAAIAMLRGLSNNAQPQLADEQGKYSTEEKP